jgi:hypothetical protein
MRIFAAAAFLLLAACQQQPEEEPVNGLPDQAWFDANENWVREMGNWMHNVENVHDELAREVKSGRSPEPAPQANSQAPNPAGL